MSNVINLDSRRPKPEPPPQFRHPFWEWIHNMNGGKLLMGLFVAAAVAVCVWFVLGGGPSKEMVESCKPDHYVGTYRVADGLHRVDCMTSTGQVRSVYQEDK